MSDGATDRSSAGLSASPEGQQQATILVVDDDDELRLLVRGFLESEGFIVLEAEGAEAMRRQLDASPVDLIVLDVMMPGEDGLSIARGLSGRTSVGIIMLSALGSENDRVTGLEIGADDYLTKPVSPRELLARIRALLRRKSLRSEAGSAVLAYRFANWQLDPVHRTLRDPEGVVVGLSEGEFRVLLSFLEHPREVLSRDQLLELARGCDSDAFDRAIDTQVSRLRRKFAARHAGEVIRTVRNEGYVFIPPVSRR